MESLRERVRESQDHQHTPTFLCPVSLQTPPLSGQQVVSEGVQLVENGDAKQPVRDKRRCSQDPQRSDCSSLTHCGSPIIDKMAVYTFTLWTPMTLWNERTLWHFYAYPLEKKKVEATFVFMPSSHYTH